MKVKMGTKNCLYPMPTTLVGVPVISWPHQTFLKESRVKHKKLRN